jgi:hydroxyquinol 1,2-dioxygenase
VWFSTIAPAAYPIPSDGPVGELMRAAGRSAVRPAHLHVRVEAPDHATVTSMLFRNDDPNLGSDPVFGVRDSLVAHYQRIDTADGPAERLSHEFVLDPLNHH